MSASILHFGERADNLNICPLKWSSVGRASGPVVVIRMGMFVAAVTLLINQLAVPICQRGLVSSTFLLFLFLVIYCLIYTKERQQVSHN